MNRCRLLTALLAAALAAAAGMAGAAEKGSFWYVLDNVTDVDEDARILLWVALPPTLPYQDVTVTGFDPAPTAVLEDAATGNRIVEWAVEPEARSDLPELVPDQIYFRFDFEYEIRPDLHAVDADTLEPYPREDATYRASIDSEIWLQTDGPVYDRAREIVGDERNPYRQGQLLYEWVIANLTFVAGGEGERDAAAVLESQRGDCSQFSVLYAAMCRSVGIPARTVTRTWLEGGYHTFTEIQLPGYGRFPVDPSLGHLMLAADEPAPTKRGVLAVLQAENPDGGPEWLYGNTPVDRLTISLGNNIRFDSPTLERTLTFRDLRPGGRYAHPAAVEIDGFNDSVVHGGFFVFGERIEDRDRIHAMVHQRLSHLFFDADPYTAMDEGCVEPMGRFATGMQAWLNEGKVNMHKGEYYRAESAFNRALLQESREPGSDPQTRVWVHNYLGNCYDLLGRREAAVEQYEAALAVGSDFRGARAYAERYLKKPFDKKPR